MLIFFNACNSSSKTGNIAVEPISVNIPVEFEQNDQITQFILEYQSLMNDFNQVAAQMISDAGIDIVSGEERISGEHLTPKSLAKKAKLTAELSEISEKREAMMATMQQRLPALTEPEQRALRGVIGLIDAHMGQFDGSIQAQNQSNDGHDEDTSQMPAGREDEIQRLKENGEWEGLKLRKNSNIFFIIPLIVFGAFLIIFRLLLRKGISQSGSFARANRSSFTQGLSHMASEMKGN
ncbi:MAG: hypothetical protein JW761_11710, partial [Prolixibacteraceae bacterium]|nr:hypothetical protein [Prolixibacteraceae bacterium]